MRTSYERGPTIAAPFPGVGTTTGRVVTARVRRKSRDSAGDWNWLLRGSLTLLILVFVGRIQEAIPIPGLSKVPFGNIAVLFTVIGLVQSGLHRDLGRIVASPQGRLAAAFLGVAAFSIPFALWPGGAALSFVELLTTWVLYVLIVLSVRRPEHLAYVAIVFALAAAILVSAYVKDWLVGVGDLTEQEFVAFDRNDVALLSVMAIPLALVLTVKSGIRTWIGFALAGFLALGVVATDSRGGFLALAVTGGLMLVNSRALRGSKRIVLISVGVVILLAGGSTEYWERIEAVFTSPSTDYNVTSRDGRLEVWKRGIGYFADNPLTGVGLGNFPVAEGESLKNEGYGVKWNTAHNAYILAAADLGIGGILVFVALLWSVLRQARRSARPPRRGRAPPNAEFLILAEATKFSVIGYAVAAIFLSVTYTVPFVFIVAMGASLSLLSPTTNLVRDSNHMAPRRRRQMSN